MFLVFYLVKSKTSMKLNTVFKSMNFIELCKTFIAIIKNAIHINYFHLFQKFHLNYNFEK